MDSARGLNFPTLVRDEVIHAPRPFSGCAGKPHYSPSPTKQAITETIFDSGGGFSAATSNLKSATQLVDPYWISWSSNWLAFGSVTTGANKTYTTPVETNLPQAQFALFWLGTDSFAPVLRLTLTNPNGTVITETMSGVEHGPTATSGFGDLMFDVYSVDAPLTGEWTLRVDGVDVRNQKHNYVVMVVVDSPITFMAKLDKESYLERQDILLTASLEQSGTAVVNSVITASVTSPDNSKAMLTLHDDGLNGDGAAGDGVSSELFPPGAVASICLR